MIDINAKPKIEQATEMKNNEQVKLSFWGATWRAIGIALLFSAAVCAIIFGMQAGTAYIVGLAMGEVATAIITGLISALGYILSLVAAAYTGNELSKIYENRFHTVFEENFDAAAA